MTAIDQKNFTLELPITVLFTGLGQEAFKDYAGSFRKVENQQGAEKDALRYSNHNIRHLQKMFLGGFVDELNIHLPDLIEKSDQIMMINKLIVQTFLQRKVNPALAGILLSSPEVQLYNQKNPEKSITKLTQIQKAEVDHFRKDRKELFKYIEEDILRQAFLEISGDSALSPTEKQNRLQDLDDLSTRIDRRIWHVYCMIYQTSLRGRIKRRFGHLLSDFLHQSRIAAHLNDLILEYMRHAQKMHFDLITMLSDLEERLLNLPDDRARLQLLRSEALSQNRSLSISWNIRTGKTGGQLKYRLQIRITSQLWLDEGTKDYLLRKTKRSEGLSLAEFYLDGMSDQSDTGSRAILYHNRLEEICKEEKITYNCRILPEPDQERVTLQLQIIF